MKVLGKDRTQTTKQKSTEESIERMQKTRDRQVPEVDMFRELKRKAIVAINLAKEILWTGTSVQVRVFPISGTVAVQCGGGRGAPQSADEAMKVFRRIGLHDVSRYKTASNRTVFIAERDGITIRLNTDIPFCRGAKRRVKTEPRTVEYYECPIDGGGSS